MKSIGLALETSGSNNPDSTEGTGADRVGIDPEGGAAGIGPSTVDPRRNRRRSTRIERQYCPRKRSRQSVPAAHRLRVNAYPTAVPHFGMSIIITRPHSLR